MINLDLDTAQLRELDVDELLAVSGAKSKKGGTRKVICTTVYYSDGSSTRTCVADKGKS
ncbi:MAG: hypothetical protein M5U32_21970 [Myxococcota bacterium]|nr:hypothetical protein [Myxococcota bacterium]